MAQAVLYPEKPKPTDVVVENTTTMVSRVAPMNVNNNNIINNNINNNNNNINNNDEVSIHKKNRIQVSNTKKPLFFYLNLAKRYMKQHNDIELSALGMAIPTLVTIAEILKANGVAVEKKVLTSTVDSKDENKGKVVQKAKLEIFLEKKPTAIASADTKTGENAAKTDAEKPEKKLTVDESKPDDNAATNAEKKEG